MSTGPAPVPSSPDIRGAHLVGSVNLPEAATALRTLSLPVPIERVDRACFAPLAAVELPEETELHLGLLHHEDGVAGARRRAAVATTARPRIGVATECGFGPSERTVRLLDLHAAVAEAR